MPAQVWPAETKQALEYGFPLLGARNAACFGLCGENDAKRLLRSGATTLGGSIPTQGPFGARIRHRRRSLNSRIKGPRRNQGPDGRRPRNIMCMAWGRPGHDMGHVMATARRGHWCPCPGDNGRAAPGRWSRRPR